VYILQAMKIKLQKYLIVTLLVLGVLPFTYAQVGINITDPNGGALLDVSSREKGVLIPRINITDLTTIAPISGLISFAEEMAAESLLVYNINDTTGRGFHYWDGTTWIPLGDKNLGKDDLTQSEEPRTYDMNGEDLNFTNGAFGINTPNPNGAIEATSTENYDAYTFTQDNSLTGEKDVFTIEDQDAGGGAQDHSSVLKVLKSGNINSGDNGFSLIELANTGSDPGANKYWISGRKIDESAVLWGVDITDNDFWSKGGLTLGITENTNGTYSSGNFRVNSNGYTGINNTNPLEALHISGTSETIRIESLNSTNNASNNGVDDAVVYVDSNGDLKIRPSLVQNSMPEDNLTTFIPASRDVTSSNGTLTQETLYTTSITLTQDALVEVVYQIGVNITDSSFNPITDGNPRQYGTALFIDTNLVGYTSEAYTSRPSGLTASSRILSGTFFLNGNGYAQLTGSPAGTTYDLSVIGFVAAGNGFGVNGEFGGNTGVDRFQIILHY
jgi:hypothetical protein